MADYATICVCRFRLCDQTIWLEQYPWEERPKQLETALTHGPEDMAKVRARNALKILLDMHGNVGRDATGQSGVVGGR